MMMAPFDSWDYDFLGEMMGVSPEKGLHAIFPHLPAMPLGEKKWEKEEIPGEPQEASVGHISLAAANELP